MKGVTLSVKQQKRLVVVLEVEAGRVAREAVTGSFLHSSTTCVKSEKHSSDGVSPLIGELPLGQLGCARLLAHRARRRGSARRQGQGDGELGAQPHDTLRPNLSSVSHDDLLGDG